MGQVVGHFTLTSLQILVRQSIRSKINLNVKLNLDISNYKIKKLKNIERLVRGIAKEVEETKIDVSLDSMNSYERRFVHNLVNTEYKNLTTESTGEGEDSQVSFEKHKIFLYKEDFGKFIDGLRQAIQYIENEGNGDLPLPEEGNTEEIKIDIDF